MSSGITHSFPWLSLSRGQMTYTLLSLSPLVLLRARLACLIHAANVHSEPGSNPSIKCMLSGTRAETLRTLTGLGSPCGSPTVLRTLKIEPGLVPVAPFIRENERTGKHSLVLANKFQRSLPNCQRANRKSQSRIIVNRQLPASPKR